MVISYMGGECFKISQGDLTLAFNPPSRDSSLKTSKFGSDIALVSTDHEDFNGIENAAFGDREPFAITGPGEYEVKGVAVRGFGAESEYGGSPSINTIYSVALEGMNLCFLGALSKPELPQAAKQELDNIDILFLPVGGDGVLDHGAAYKLAVQLEPKAIVPMHYGDMGGKDALKAFLKEAGAEDVQPVDKLTVKKKDLDGKEGEIIVLSV
ncbi:MAG TPA: MBL fold metallo-hydrolase [Candidatus Paceibacterota bacterium]|nr:MBL fold metallo-hydrolase [Candidatus Paceibacterota bacterium]